MHGQAALPPDFTHLPYVNPDAPKGGTYREAVVGTFDSLNPLIVRGQPAAGTRTYIYESLMARNRAEAFSLYGLIAESIDVSPDRRRVTFRLRPEARFSDGKPLTSADVIFSFETLRDHGRPNHRTYYSKVLRAVALDDHTVTFELEGGDRELVLILGLMPVLPKHLLAGRDFEKTTLEPPVGSGPYTVSEVKPGDRVVYRRNPDYWGKDLPVNRGQWNFDELRFDYFRDNQAAFEAFKKHLVDIRSEQDPSRWATGYDFEAVKSGDAAMVNVPTGLPKPASGLVMNTRRPLFSDVRVREALVHAFDFEWANANLFHSLFERTEGYFDGSELSAIGVPASEREKSLLASAGTELPRAILDGTYRLPVSDGSGRDRANLRKALKLMADAGWTATDGVLRNAKGEPFVFELLVQNREQERIGLHFQRSLKQLGVDMSLRQVDSAQFQRRLETYDFDMLPFTWYNSLSPGNEQSFYWGSAGRTVEGTRNYMGAAEPAIDRMIEEIVKAEDRPDYVDAVRALDRLLVAGHYMVPLYHAPGQWIARWKDLKFPDKPSLYGLDVEAGWFDVR